MLLCIEMFLFSLLHIVAFPFSIYDVRKSEDPAAHYVGGTMGWRAFADAFNPWDFVKAFARGFRWLAVGRRQRDGDPNTPFGASTKLEPFSRPVGSSSSSGGVVPPGAYAPPAGPPPRSSQPYDGPADDARAYRAGSDASDEDKHRLLAHAADVPTIAVRAPSPFRDASPDARLRDEEARVGGGSGAPAPPAYDAYKPRRARADVDTPPSDDDDDDLSAPPVRLPGDGADLEYHGGQRVVR